MFRKVIILIAITSLCLAMLVGCGGSGNGTVEEENQTNIVQEEASEINVGFVFIGNPQDGGWSAQHDKGRLEMERELGVNTFTAYDLLPTERILEVAEEMIERDGVSVLFATSFGYGEYLLELAERYPDVKFMHCSGINTRDNIGTYFGYMEYPRFLTGMVGGEATESNKIGFVASFEYPEVIRQINAFTLGARHINPDVEVMVEFTHDWSDKERATDAANLLADRGADVLVQFQDTPYTQMVAEERGLKSIGYHADMIDSAPNAHLVSSIWDWGQYYTEQVRRVIEGNWVAEAYMGSMQDGLCGISEIRNIEGEIINLVREMESEFKAGEINVFAGELRDNTGVVRVTEGDVLDSEGYANMDWFVEGVDATIVQY